MIPTINHKFNLEYIVRVLAYTTQVNNPTSMKKLKPIYSLIAQLLPALNHYYSDSMCSIVSDIMENLSQTKPNYTLANWLSDKLQPWVITFESLQKSICCIATLKNTYPDLLTCEQWQNIEKILDQPTKH